MFWALNNTHLTEQPVKPVDKVCATVCSSLALPPGFAFAASLIFSTCGSAMNGTEMAMSSADSARVIAEVEAATWAFHAADTSRSAAAIVNLLWPEYSMLVDGSRLTYDQVAASTPEFMSSLSLFYTEWTSLRVIPLGASAAVSSFVFQDSSVTRAGELLRNQGTTSFVWQRRGEGWRLLYADANHRPVMP